MIFKKRIDTTIHSPINGSYLAITKVHDTTFSSKLMGDGFAVEPTEDLVRSPIDGKITMIFPTKHALGITRRDGLEILLHIGIETVNLNGEGFQVKVKKGDSIKMGDALVTFDRRLLADKQLDSTIMVIFTNGDQFHIKMNEHNGILHNGDVVGYAEKQ